MTPITIQGEGDIFEDRRRQMPRATSPLPIQPTLRQGVLFQVRSPSLSSFYLNFKVVFEHLIIHDGKDCWKSPSSRQVMIQIFWENSFSNFTETWDNTTQATPLLLFQIISWSDCQFHPLTKFDSHQKLISSFVQHCLCFFSCVKIKVRRKERRVELLPVLDIRRTNISAQKTLTF